MNQLAYFVNHVYANNSLVSLLIALLVLVILYYVLSLLLPVRILQIVMAILALILVLDLFVGCAGTTGGTFTYKDAQGQEISGHFDHSK